jgi:hypothetical protein
MLHLQQKRQIFREPDTASDEGFNPPRPTPKSHPRISVTPFALLRDFD